MTAQLYPPGPRGLPFLGNLRDVQTNMMPFLANVARDYGDIAYVRVPGQHLYLINHPALIREILV